ncbi:DUF262 domain-containing protein [Helicobacter fennelliae]|uniref:DUF262 domain-containing protein n=1 Tax=Helicobacter fennelliae TaxID=215 RepID=UPI000DFB68FE|nr:DUF262 domain-containing protein [Helicobacter fennelliae]STQ84993.1 RloF like protein [Helicobacter fennelliae]
MEFKPEKICIAKLLSEDGQKFVIPEYQRPYRWANDECETLWNDIISVFGDGSDIEEYFLGSIVTYKNDNGELEIIDGQQRITTLTLLYRAFYETFKTEEEKAKGDYPRDFGKCVWDYERDKGLLFENCHLSSQVVTDADEKILKQLLSENCEVENKHSNYAKNYDYFYDKLLNFKQEKSLVWKGFCEMFLGRKLFVLLVVCDSQESAMTIFNTLNSRGLPLSNADILKGYIYKKVSAKTEFANAWKDIESKVGDSDNIKDLDFLFLQYMHIIRAENEDIDTTTQSVLNFFTKKDKKKKCFGALQDWLYKEETIPFISNLADFWIKPENYLNDTSSRYISILNLFQNDTWKIFVSYLVWRNKKWFNDEQFNKEKFSSEFDKFLPELTKFITLPFLNNNATTATIREIVFKMNVNLYKGVNLAERQLKQMIPTELEFFKTTENFDTRKTKYILFLYAHIYDDFQNDISSVKLEVEHILPKKWQNANFNGWNEQIHEEYLEKIGNKILLDKRSNIKCVENFFAKKQEEYKKIYGKANLKEVYDLGCRAKNTWVKDDIDKRSEEIYNNLAKFLQ